jgi:type VI secretion system protein VasJ
MTKINEHSLFLIGSTPISEDQPCGANVRYESDFEQLEAELAKQESLSAETVDWDVVAQLSSRIIQNSSKDLLVGSYLCYALLVKDGYHGLGVGINVLNDMVSLHWDCLFPPVKRMRARQTAFTWLAEKAGDYVSTTIPTSKESGSVVEAADMLKQLDGALVEKMGDQAPMLTELSRPLKNYRQSAEAELAKSETVAPAVEPPAESVPQESSSPSAVVETAEPQDAAPAPVNPAPVAKAATKSKAPIAPPPDAGSLESDADSKKILRQLQTTARDIAGFWMTQKVSDSRSYRVARVAAFMVVENAPPDNNGVTQINPPAPERLKFFEAQAGKGDVLALIPELEKTLARSPFWFDGQFLVVKSLRSLGAEYEAAVQTVIRELGNFISRLPDVVGLSFSNEAPFADDQTRMWLDAEVIGQSSGALSDGTSESPSGELWSSVLVEAKKLAASGDADKALAMMSKGMSSACQLREQVYWRCAIAELMLQTGKADTAASVLEQASQQAKAMQIPEWEPQLLAKIYNLLVQSYQKQLKTNKEDKSLKEKAEVAYEQLCWFDPVTALSVKGG